MTKTTIIRTFQKVSIQWDRGSVWSGYEDAEQAQATVDFAASRGGDVGHVLVEEYEVELSPELALLARPGIRPERVLVSV